MDPEPVESRWVRRARVGIVALAAVGILACLYVALVLWRSWPDNPGTHSLLVDLGLAVAFAAPTVWCAVWGPRLIGVPAALGLLYWGAMGTWLYGFLWVPGVAALLGCLLPRPARTNGPDAGPRNRNPGNARESFE